MTDATAESSPYDRLAHHLAPDDPAQGYAAIDRAILDQLRVKAARGNMRWVLWRTCPILAIALIDIPIAWGLLAWLVTDPKTVHLPFAIPHLPLWALLGGPALGLIIINGWFYLIEDHVLTRVFPDPPLAPVMAEWLAVNRPNYPTLHYWDEVFWPSGRRLAQRSSFLGFTYWPELSPSELADRIARLEGKAVRP